MKKGIKPGIKTLFDITVTEDMRPQFDGIFVHDVMSTVSMVYYMERAGRLLILPYLDVDEDSAGFALDIKHVGPAVIGQNVTFTAVCTEVRPTRVVCDVRAVTDCNVVGEGIFTQAIFPKDLMDKRIARLTSRIAQGGAKAEAK